MLESRAGIIFVAGIGFFAFAFLSNVVVPIAMYKDLPEQRVEEVVNDSVMYQFTELSRRYPESFRQAYGEPTEENCAQALRLWDARSTSVKAAGIAIASSSAPCRTSPAAYGQVSQAKEYQNELQRPVMFGTRRVGPDLSREGGRHGNDWHVAHFYKPKMIVPESPMPEYPWLFDGAPGQPNKRGIALITYIQWLGSWLASYPYYEELESITSEGY